LPIVLDERCVFTGETARWSRANYKVQIGCSLDALRAVLGALRREGAYDNTVIVLMADHGTPGMVSARVGSEGSGRINGSMIGLANPTLAVKPFNAKGKFRRARELVSVADVSTIICESVGDCVGRRRAPRVGRVYNSFAWSQSYIKQDRIPEIVGYEISGTMFESRNWRRIDAAP
jgi:arylsulfatase A-like enzyme